VQEDIGFPAHGGGAKYRADHMNFGYFVLSGR
jgi:hypothetical protein